MVKKYKRDSETSYALGATITMELLKRRPELARTVYISPRSDISAVTELAEKLGVRTETTEKPFNILSPKGNCFVIGEFDKFAAPISGDKHHIVLVNPSDGGNLGTIMRDVAAFDCADLAIIRPAVDPFDPKTVRASMGALFNINFELFDSFDEYSEKRGAGHTVMPFMLDRDGRMFGEVSFDRSAKYSLAFGNEATGLDKSFAKFGAVMIEQSEKADSLNLSTAVAIAMYKLMMN